jgi:molybdopterin converting factor small subunit
MPHVTVRFFARYAELTGRESAAVVVPGSSATVAEVLERVRETVPGARDLPPRPLAALNLRQVKLDARVKDGDEVALLPPLSGG